MAKATKKRAPKAQARNAPNARERAYEAGRLEALARIGRLLRLCSIGVPYTDRFDWTAIPAYSATYTDSLRALFDPPGDYFDRAEKALAFIVADEPEGDTKRLLLQLMRRVSIAGAAGDVPTMVIVASALRIVRDMGGSAAAEWGGESPFGLPDLERAFIGRGRDAGRVDEYALRLGLRQRTPDEIEQDAATLEAFEELAGIEVDRGATRPAREDDKLTELDLKILAAMVAARAEILSLTRITERVSGVYEQGSTDRKTVSERLNGVLTRREFVLKGHGRKGGYWLTEAGRVRGARELAPKGVV
jgi:hypothetical protein